MSSIRKRTWVSKGVPQSAWVIDYFDQAKVKRRKTFATKKQAVDWATTALHEVKQGVHTPPAPASLSSAPASYGSRKGKPKGLNAVRSTSGASTPSCTSTPSSAVVAFRTSPRPQSTSSMASFETGVVHLRCVVRSSPA